MRRPAHFNGRDRRFVPMDVNNNNNASIIQVFHFNRSIEYCSPLLSGVGIACVESVFVQFRSKERDRAKNGAKNGAFTQIQSLNVSL